MVDLRHPARHYPFTRLRYGDLDRTGHRRLDQAFGGLGPGVRGKSERGPVEGNQYPVAARRTVEIAVGRNGLLRIHVDVGPGFVVGADREQGEIERAVLAADVAKAAGVSGIAAEERAMRGSSSSAK